MCNNNLITELDNLPNSLKILECSYNQISNLDNLPNGLTCFECNFNQITSLENLPYTLESLFCKSKFMIRFGRILSSLKEIKYRFLEYDSDCESDDDY